MERVSVIFAVSLLTWVALRTLGMWFPKYTIIPEVVAMFAIIASSFGMGKLTGVEEMAKAMQRDIDSYVHGAMDNLRGEEPDTDDEA